MARLLDVVRILLDLFAVLALVFIAWRFFSARRATPKVEILGDEVDSTVKEVTDVTDKVTPKLCPFCREIVEIEKNRFVEHVRVNEKLCAGSLMTPTAARFVARRNRGLNGSEQASDRNRGVGEDDWGEVPEGRDDPTDEE